jgi:hypothetical protein
MGRSTLLSSLVGHAGEGLIPGRAVLDYQTACHQAAITGQQLPSILSKTPANIQAA